MKRVIIIMLLLCTSILLAESILRNWESYTNTTHISDLEYTGDKLYIATWGGLLEYNLEEEYFSDLLKMDNGLTEHDLSSVKLLADSTLLIGTKGGGINRLKDESYLMPLQIENGLAANDIYGIAVYEDKYAAITSEGISIFSGLPVWPLPAVQNYSLSDGLSGSEYRAIAVNDEGILFCGSDSGIDYADLNANVLEWQNISRSNSGLGSDEITSISCLGNNMAVATRQGLYFTSDYSDQDSWVEFGDGGAYFPVMLSESGTIWSSKGYWDESSLSVIDSSEEMVISYTETGEETIWNTTDLGTISSMVTDIIEVEDKIIVSTWGEGILIYDGIMWGDAQVQDCIGANFTTVLKLDFENRLWVGNGILDSPDKSRGDSGVSVFDGYNWRTFTTENSGIGSDNINSIAAVGENEIWFTAYTDESSNNLGVTRLDYSQETNPSWEFHQSDSIPLPEAEIGNCLLAKDGMVWLTVYNTAGDGVIIVDRDMNVRDSFMSPDVVYEGRSNTIYCYQGEVYALAGGRYTGFAVWESSEVPQTEDLANWKQPNNEDFTDGQVLDAVERYELFEDQLWVATTRGLYMYDGEMWFRYGKESTKRQYLEQSGTSWNWEPTELEIGVNDSPDWWYFEGQERLYGGENTYPTALLVDPFNNLWIGSATNGICRYDLENNKFKTWNTGNSPLLDDKINDLVYDKETGRLYIATDRGLNSVQIGISADYNQEDELSSILVYPNPFYPAKDEIVRIENKDHLSMPSGGTSCNIYDLEGLLVAELTLNNFRQFEWDGKNEEGKECSSGLYFYLVTSTAGDVGKGKIILVR